MVPYRIPLWADWNLNRHHKDQWSRSHVYVIIHAHLLSNGILLIQRSLQSWSEAKAGFIAYDSSFPLREFRGHQGSMCLLVNQYRSHPPCHRLALPPLRPCNWFRWTHLVLLTGPLIVPRIRWEEILKPFPLPKKGNVVAGADPIKESALCLSLYLSLSYICIRLVRAVSL